MKKIVTLILSVLLFAPGVGTAAVRKEAPDPSASATKAVQQKLDLNRASPEELVGVPGIGSRLAQAIVDLRTKKGSFKQIEELLEVPGVKKKKLAKIAVYLDVVPPPATTTPAISPR